MLMVAIAAVPAIGAVVCLDSAPPGMQCCPMASMDHSSPVTQFEATNTRPSCCDISSGKPAPVAEIQAPIAVVAVAAPASAFVGASIADFVPYHQRLIPPLPDSVSPQSVLCTFLI
jgi:hypothetical protein